MRKSDNELSIGLGDCTGHKQTKWGLAIETTTDKIEISVYNSTTIRIRAVQKEKDFSYAVIAEPQQTSFTVNDTANSIELVTAELKLLITKKAVKFSFYNKEGKLVNTDDNLGVSRIGNQITAYKKLQDGERFIGLGEKTGNLDRRGTAYTMWNTDFFSYGVNADPIYMSIPFYIGIHNQTAYGIFFDNTAKGKFNFGASNDRFASFSAEAGELNYYFIYGSNVRQVIENYTWLTGRMELPPVWSLGFQQCRYSYYPDKRVLNIARSFREKKIPADVIYLDIHYMQDYKVFSFDKDRFPEPEKMVKELQEMGFETVVILDPGIKTQEGYTPYDEGIKNDYFAKYPDGVPYAGEVWPGRSHFPDFTKEEVREWWGDQLKFYTDKGINGYWNDMNEPAVWGQSVPDVVMFHYEGENATSLKAHNIYGMQMCRSTQQGYKKNVPGKRPFVLNRAGYAGIQRYGASWTGDNIATDEHMMCGIRLVNALGLSGVPFSGYDVGGFAGEPSPELFARWISVGAFSPMFRCHSMINTKDAEPWSFGEEVEEISRNYIGLRYRLMPYVYATFRQAAEAGLPVARSLAIDHAHEAPVYDLVFQNQYFFGDAFLIAPVESNKEMLRVYLPEGIWYDLHTGALTQSGIIISPSRKERLPVFIKGSSIIPMRSLVQSAKEKPNDVLDLHIYKGDTDNSFELYEDDGQTYGYTKQEYLKRNIVYSPKSKKITISATEGKYKSQFKKVKLYLHSFDKAASYSVNGQKATSTKENYQFIAPVSLFDPFYTEQATDMIEKDVPFIQFENTNHETTITW